MGPLLGEVAELIKASLPETIELELRVNAEEATVEGDVIRLHQLVMNLCTNAVQAMPDGGRLAIALDKIELGKRRVQRRHTVEPGSYVRLEVTDTGHGIDEVTLDRVFDPSPPRISAREPGSVCLWHTASSATTGAPSRF